MTLLGDIAKELVGMFLADARLSGAVLALVVIVVVLTKALAIEPLIGGGVLLAGCLAILLGAVVREARRARSGGD